MSDVRRSPIITRPMMFNIWYAELVLGGVLG